MFDSSGETLIVSYSTGHNVWNLSTGREESYPGYAIFSRSGRAAASIDGTITLLDRTRGKREGVLRFPNGSPLTSQDRFATSDTTGLFSPDENTLALLSPTGRVMLVRRDSNPTYKVLDTLALSITFWPKGAYLVTGNREGGLDAWNARTGAWRARVRGPQGKIFESRFSPDGLWLATWGSEGLQLWDVKTWKSVEKLERLARRHINDIEWSPDSRSLAFALDDSTCEVWDIVVDSPSLRLSGHGGLVVSVAFSPDGSRLATTSKDGKVRIWELPAMK